MEMGRAQVSKIRRRLAIAPPPAPNFQMVDSGTTKQSLQFTPSFLQYFSNILQL